MDYLYALILGIVEGATEFLPISSTAHLILTAKLLRIPQNTYWTFFEVFIQSGAILAVAAAFLKELKDKKTIMSVMTSFVPTAIVGFILHEVIKKYFFNSTWLIGWALLLFSFVFLFLEYLVKNKKIKLHKDAHKLTMWEAICVGLFQALAVVPGVSRAGAVLIGMMFMGYKRESAALYSFMLAVPTILAATALDLIKTDKQILMENIGVSIVGFVVAFVSAYFVVRWLINYLKKNTLVPFAYYRIALAAVVMVAVVLLKF